MQSVPRAKAEIRLFYYTLYCLISQPNLVPGPEVPNPGCFSRQEGSSADHPVCADQLVTLQHRQQLPIHHLQHSTLKCSVPPAALRPHGKSTGRAAWVSPAWQGPASYYTQSPSYLHVYSRVWECHQRPGAAGKYQAATLRTK